MPREARDDIARLATGVIGGPRGRFANVDSLPRSGPPVGSDPRLIVVSGLLSLGGCLMIAVGFLQKSFCVRYGWGAPDVYRKACYSDLPSYVSEGGLSGGLPYDIGSALSEPVGTGVVLRLLAAVIPPDGFERQQGIFVAWTILAAVLTVVTVTATVWTSRRHPERAAHVAFSPLLVTVALVSADLVGVAVTAVALWLWSARRPGAAGVVLGLAIACRTYPLLILVVLGVLAVRSGTVRVWARTAGAALVTWVLVVGAVALVHGTGALTAYQVWTGAGAQLGSPWYLATLAGKPIPMGTVTVLAILGWAFAVAAGALLSLGAAVRPRIGEVALVVLVLVMITGKSVPVQMSLWLVPLVALAGLPWRDHLLWAATEVLSFVAVWLYLGGLDDPAAALPKEWYAAFLVLRVLGMAWLAVAATRQALRRTPVPGHDGVAPVEIDDAAGPMWGRPDAVVVRYVR